MVIGWRVFKVGGSVGVKERRGRCDKDGREGVGESLFRVLVEG